MHATRANTLPNPERVQIWNTFFHQAWLEAKTLHEKSHGSHVTKHFKPKGETPAWNDRAVLALLVQCTLAIEARANHLIDELIKKNEITEAEGRAAQQLPARGKWFLLPRIAGVKTHLSDKTSPHQAIAEICAMRNNLAHVNFKRLRSALPIPARCSRSFGILDLPLTT